MRPYHCLQCGAEVTLASIGGKCLGCWADDKLADIDRVEAEEAKRCVERVCKLVQDGMKEKKNAEAQGDSQTCGG